MKMYGKNRTSMLKWLNISFNPKKENGEINSDKPVSSDQVLTMRI